MRGSPLWRAVVTFLLLLALAPILWQVTRAVPREAPVDVTPTGPRTVALDLAFTTAPKKVRLLYSGQPVWQKDAPESREECELQLAWPKEGGDLVFQVDWAEDAPLSAVRARLTDPDGAEYERSLWGTGHVEKVLSFP